MKVKLDELDKLYLENDSKIKRLKIELVKEMRGYAYDDDEMLSFVTSNEKFSEYMKYVFGKYWPKEHASCGIMSKGCMAYDDFIKTVKPMLNELFEKYFIDVVENLEIPPKRYYRLRSDALEKAFGNDPLELYRKRPEDFKLYFETVKDEKQEELIRLIFSNDSRNDSVDGWLSEKHADVVKKAGREFVVQQ